MVECAVYFIAIILAVILWFVMRIHDNVKDYVMMYIYMNMKFVERLSKRSEMKNHE